MKTFKQVFNEKKFNLKDYVKAIAKFTSWEFEGDYEDLIIKFKDASDTKKVFKKLNSNKDFDILDFADGIRGNYRDNTITLLNVKDKLFEAKKKPVKDLVYEALNLLEDAMTQTNDKKLRGDINKSFSPLIDIQARLETGGFYNEK